MFTWKSNKNSLPLTNWAHKHRPKPQSPGTGSCFPWDTHSDTRTASTCVSKTNRKIPPCSVSPACGNLSLPGWVRTGGPVVSLAGRGEGVLP